jgi:hypothetical protein
MYWIFPRQICAVCLIFPVENSQYGKIVNNIKKLFTLKRSFSFFNPEHRISKGPTDLR